LAVARSALSTIETSPVASAVAAAPKPKLEQIFQRAARAHVSPNRRPVRE